MDFSWMAWTLPTAAFFTTIFLMRAALFRERMSGRNTVPPSVSAPHGTLDSGKTKGKP